MGLGHFELHIAFGATQDFAFFHFVFIQINFGIAFRASGHVLLSFLGQTFTGKRII